MNPQSTESTELTAAIAADPTNMTNYWRLGLALLLEGKEDEAQGIWMEAMLDGEPEQLNVWMPELFDLLVTAAAQYARVGKPEQAWVIRRHAREVFPDNLPNLLHLVLLTIALERFTVEEFVEWELVPLLGEMPSAAVPAPLLLETLQRVLDVAPAKPQAIEFLQACLPHLQGSPDLLHLLSSHAARVAATMKRFALGAYVMEMAAAIYPDNLDVLRLLASYAIAGDNRARGLAVARDCFHRADTTLQKLLANEVLLRGVLESDWQEGTQVAARQEQLLRQLCDRPPGLFDRNAIGGLLISSFFFNYLEDAPQRQRPLLNAVMSLCQQNINAYAAPTIAKFAQGRTRQSLAVRSDRPLKIGYVSHHLRRHSIGWLARWLFRHHDRDRCQIYSYFLGYQPSDDRLQAWYEKYSDRSFRGDLNTFAVAEQIAADDLDILVELDGISMDVTCEIVALKPAPIQVNWLGLDASGLPTVDYFLADPYVLPENAQTYYRETIWRLPHTYIAVDGFEVGIPTLRRDRLGISTDAVIYLSAQRGLKRHPDTVRLQMQILAAVPHSYLLIKGLGDELATQQLFLEIAAREGVSGDRLKFLEQDASEEVHRANLAIADVVLDTYPYNGATTTLETLWMGVPLVTRVGEQFVARNSYTMLMNAGVTEGIAWSAAEYVAWGIRLGQDAGLRRQISQRLWESRQRAPLWNGAAFAREVENAYAQMVRQA